MTILIATSIFPPDSGGPATYSKMLFEELPKRGIKIEVVVLSKKLPYIIRHIAYFVKLLKMGKQVDIIYAQDPLGAGLPAAFAAKLLRKKLVIRIAGDRAWETGTQKFGVKDLLDEFSVKNSYGLAISILKRAQFLCANLADKIITPSHYLKKIVSNWGVKPEKINVIYNAFTVPQITTTKAEARKEFDISGTVLISVGRLVPWKGFEVLIDIMPDIRKLIPDVKFYIIDDGPRKEILKEKIAQLKAEEYVILVGRISHADTLKYLVAGDVFVLNTGYEGMSFLLLETLSVGLPIVTTPNGGNPEVIENNFNGLLTEYNNGEAFKKTILYLLQNTDLRQTLVANGKNSLAQFNLEKLLSEIIAVLKTL